MGQTASLPQLASGEAFQPSSSAPLASGTASGSLEATNLASNILHIQTAQACDPKRFIPAPLTCDEDAAPKVQTGVPPPHLFLQPAGSRSALMDLPTHSMQHAARPRLMHCFNLGSTLTERHGMCVMGCQQVSCPGEHEPGLLLLI